MTMNGKIVLSYKSKVNTICTLMIPVGLIFSNGMACYTTIYYFSASFMLGLKLILNNLRLILL